MVILRSHQQRKGRLFYSFMNTKEWINEYHQKHFLSSYMACRCASHYICMLCNDTTKKRSNICTQYNSKKICSMTLFAAGDRAYISLVIKLSCPGKASYSSNMSYKVWSLSKHFNHSINYNIQSKKSDVSCLRNDNYPIGSLKLNP